MPRPTDFGGQCVRPQTDWFIQLPRSQRNIIRLSSVPISSAPSYIDCQCRGLKDLPQQRLNKSVLLGRLFRKHLACVHSIVPQRRKCWERLNWCACTTAIDQVHDVDMGFLQRLRHGVSHYPPMKYATSDLLALCNGRRHGIDTNFPAQRLPNVQFTCVIAPVGVEFFSVTPSLILSVRLASWSPLFLYRQAGKLVC